MSEDFRDFVIRNVGFDPGNVISDGRIHRFSTKEGRARDDAGWYAYHGSFGVCGDHRTGSQFVWRCTSYSKADQVLSVARAASDDHPYLVRKKISGVGLLEASAHDIARAAGYRVRAKGKYLTGRILIAPLISKKGMVSTVEMIDENGVKTALYGGTKSGCFWQREPLMPSGSAAARVVVGEGVATTASVAEAIGAYGVASMCSTNLVKTAIAVREKIPSAEIIVLADLKSNTGEPEPQALAAAQAVDGVLAVPLFADRRPKDTDFNDLLVKEGRDAVVRSIDAAVARHAESKRAAQAEVVQAGADVSDETGDADHDAEDGRKTIIVHPDRRAAIVDEVIGELVKQNKVFMFGGVLCSVVHDRSGQKLSQVTQEWLLDCLSRMFLFVKQTQIKKRGNKHGAAAEQASAAGAVPIFPPNWLAQAVIARAIDDPRIEEITALTDLPTPLPSGGVSSVGLNPGGLYYVGKDYSELFIDVEPNEAVGAARRILSVIDSFPFADKASRGAALAAIMTAIIRPAITVAPWFVISSPMSASGKTILAESILSLRSSDPAVITQSGANEHEEFRKRMFALLMSGEGAFLFDNVHFDESSPYAAMCAMITSGRYTDRLLGHSTTKTVPNRMMAVLTGRNVLLPSDMLRRVVKINIDPEVERPDKRVFAHDPRLLFKTNRKKIALDVCTIVSAWRAAGSPVHVSAPMASFSEWDRMVRNVICWLSHLDCSLGLSDPISFIEEELQSNEEVASLIDVFGAIESRYGNKPISSREIASDCAKIPEFAALFLDAGSGTTSVIAIGRWLSRHAGVIAGGLMLKRAKKVANRNVYIVDSAIDHQTGSCAYE